MVTLNDYKASSIKVRYMWHENKTKEKNVLKDFPLFLVIPKYYIDSKIRRIWVGLVLLKESVGIKCAMCDQHVEY